MKSSPKNGRTEHGEKRATYLWTETSMEHIILYVYVAITKPLERIFRVECLHISESK